MRVHFMQVLLFPDLAHNDPFLKAFPELKARMPSATWPELRILRWLVGWGRVQQKIVQRDALAGGNEMRGETQQWFLEHSAAHVNLSRAGATGHQSGDAT